jgi:hypothetical protein
MTVSFTQGHACTPESLTVSNGIHFFQALQKYK